MINGRTLLFLSLIGNIIYFTFLVVQHKAPQPFPVVNYGDAKNAIKRAESQTVGINLRDTTFRWQILPTHRQTSKMISAATDTLGSGVCTIDINRDGWLDIIFVGGSGHTRFYGAKSWWHQSQGNRLFINHNGRYFSDQTEKFGLKSHFHGMGCGVADLDQDNWPDLILTGVGGNLVYKNSLGTQFIDITDKTGINSEEWSTNASIGDFNNDGLPDIYITNYIQFKKGQKTFEFQKGFMSSSPSFNPALYDSLPNKLYLNKGNFQFVDITDSVGVSNKLGRSLGAKWVDINADGWSDLFVLNDSESPNQVFINQSGKKFERASAPFNLLEVTGGRDASFFHYNSDSVIDTLITRKRGEQPIFFTSNSESESVDDSSWRLDIAHINNFNKSLWGQVASDFNNDGYIDFYLAAGANTPDIDSPYVPQGQNNLLLSGSKGKFTPMSLQSSEPYPMSSRGAISVDLDNDGALDLLVSNNNNTLQIFQNQTRKGNWIGFDLTTENLGDYFSGATITVITQQKEFQHLHSQNTGYLSQGDYRVHIGLGDINNIEKVIIKWPSGSESVFEGITPNHYYSVDKKNNLMRPINFGHSTNSLIDRQISQLNAEEKIRLATLLIQLKSPDAIFQLFELWEISEQDLKTEILKKVRDNWDPKFTWLIKDALTNDTSDELKLYALNIVKRVELESSVYWLIPLLSDKNEELQCETANVLRFFFDEEEAITHRKYLAVSPLIKTLEHSPKVAICAANALAAAEHKRATLPLLRLAKTHQDESVKSAAIRALGLIRDSRAYQHVINVLENLESYSATEITEALIASKRLSTNERDEVLNNLFTIDEFDDSDIDIKKAKTLALLLSKQEDSVFSTNHINNYVKDTIENNKLDLNNTPHVATILQIIRSAKLAKYLPKVRALTTHPVDSIRVEALVTMLSLEKNSINLIENQLLDLQHDDFISVISMLENNSLVLSDSGIERLYQLVMSEPYANDVLDIALQKLNSNAKTKIAKAFLEDHTRPTNTTTFHKICTTFKNTKLSERNLNITLVFDSPEAYQKSMCLLNGINAQMIVNANITRFRVAVNNAYTSNNIQDQQKLELIVIASKIDNVIANTTLLPQLEKLPDSYLADAIAAISLHPHTIKSEEKLWAITTKDQLPLSAKLEAYSALTSRNREKVIQRIQSETPKNGNI